MRKEGNALVSIIVPVYNVEEYLEQCVDSLLYQIYPAIEVILVDDGSSDASPEICDNYGIKDSRVKVIHKVNGGASEARNVGIDVSSGKYIIFVDSDDFWCDQYVLKNLVEVLENADTEVDFVNFNCNYFYQKKNLIKHWPAYPELVLNAKDKKAKIIHLIECGVFPMSPCMKLIKKEFLIKNNIYFINGTTSEDIPWFMELLLKSRDFIFINEYYYMYRKQIAESVSSSFSEKKYQDLYTIIREEIIKIQETVEDMILQKALLSFMAYEYCILMGLVGHFSFPDRKRYVEKLREYKWLLYYDIHPKVRKVKLLLRFAGARLTRWALLFYITHVVNKN